MNKEERIKRYGEDAYEKHLEQSRISQKTLRERNPDIKKQRNHEISRKGGKYYDKQVKKDHTGLRGARNRIRGAHRTQYKPYKDIIAPDSNCTMNGYQIQTSTTE